MTRHYASGGNYNIELTDDGIAVCRVRRRTDVDLDTGARFANEKTAHFKALVAAGARGLLFNLTDAPPVAGPKTEESLAAMLTAWEEAHIPVAVVTGNNAVLNLQLKRLLRAAAPSFAEMFIDEKSAETWLRGMVARRGPNSRS